MRHGAFNSNITDKEEIFFEINHIHDLEGRQGNLFLLAVKNMYIKFEIQMSVPNFLNCTKTQYTHTVVRIQCKVSELQGPNV